jgi:hypothetical protein
LDFGDKAFIDELRGFGLDCTSSAVFALGNISPCFSLTTFNNDAYASSFTSFARWFPCVLLSWRCCDLLGEVSGDLISITTLGWLEIIVDDAEDLWERMERPLASDLLKCSRRLGVLLQCESSVSFRMMVSGCTLSNDLPRC